MVATVLFQHCYAVLRKNSSLRIVTCHSRPQSPSFLGWSRLVGYKLSRVALGTRMVTCNITGASGFITGTKEIRTKLDICFPHGSGGVTYVVKASYFVLAHKLLCGDNKLKGGTRGISPFARGTRLQLARCTCARKPTPCISALRVLNTLQV